MTFKTVLVFSFIILYTSVFKVNSQTISIKEGNVKLEFIKARIEKYPYASDIYIKSKDIERIFVKIKMKTLNNKKEIFNPNDFSLIDFKNGLRYRPTDMLFQYFGDWQHFRKITKRKPKRKIFKNIYEPEIDDSFLNYKFDGVKNVDMPINLGRKDLDIHIFHFEPRKLKSKNIYIYFPFPKDLKEGVIYYGNDKLADIDLNK